MLQIPEGLEEYINDYKAHIFEIAYLTEEQVKLFRSDFRIVADYFVQKKDAALVELAQMKALLVKHHITTM